MSRYEMRPHKHSAEYPYDGGHAIYDTLERRQVGYYSEGKRCAQAVEQRNRETLPPPAPAPKKSNPPSPANDSCGTLF